jgi:hypothetical protein
MGFFDILQSLGGGSAPQNDPEYTRALLSGLYARDPRNAAYAAQRRRENPPTYQDAIYNNMYARDPRNAAYAAQRRAENTPGYVPPVQQQRQQMAYNPPMRSPAGAGGGADYMPPRYGNDPSMRSGMGADAVSAPRPLAQVNPEPFHSHLTPDAYGGGGMGPLQRRTMYNSTMRY